MQQHVSYSKYSKKPQSNIKYSTNNWSDIGCCVWRKEGNVLFNDALNTFYLRLYGVIHMVKDHSDSERETRCRHMGYSFRLAARVLLYASHRQDNTYHSLCYTSRGALAGTRLPIAPWANALTKELHLALCMKDKHVSSSPPPSSS